jgi:hypothetical protein
MKIKYTTLSLRESLFKLFEILNAASLTPDTRLTDTEINVLIEFLLLPDDKFHYQRFSTLARTKVIQNAKTHHQWELSRENVNNKIYSMVDKNYLRRDEDSVIYIAKHIQALANAVKDAHASNKPFTLSVEFSPPSETNKES